MTQNDSPRRQIYHQGHFDGACFLYSIANAYKALTGKMVTRSNWDRAIAHAPRPVTFLQSSVGATELETDQAVSVIRDLLYGFGTREEGFEIRQIERSAGLIDLCNLISSDAVVYFAFRGHTEFQQQLDHLVCGVAASSDPIRLHIACSSAFSHRHFQDGAYFERYHSEFDRYSNDSIAVNNVVSIAPNWRWKITLLQLDD